MKTPKIDTSGTAAAQRAIAEAQAAANNLQKNFQADLQTENLTKVVAGGDATAALPESGQRKRKPQGGLASQLGINV